MQYAQIASSVCELKSVKSSLMTMQRSSNSKKKKKWIYPAHQCRDFGIGNESWGFNHQRNKSQVNHLIFKRKIKRVWCHVNRGSILPPETQVQSFQIFLLHDIYRPECAKSGFISFLSIYVQGQKQPRKKTVMILPKQQCQLALVWLRATNSPPVLTLFLRGIAELSHHPVCERALKSNTHTQTHIRYIQLAQSIQIHDACNMHRNIKNPDRQAATSAVPVTKSAANKARKHNKTKLSLACCLWQVWS